MAFAFFQESFGSENESEYDFEIEADPQSEIQDGNTLLHKEGHLMFFAQISKIDRTQTVICIKKVNEKEIICWKIIWIFFFLISKKKKFSLYSHNLLKTLRFYVNSEEQKKKKEKICVKLLIKWYTVTLMRERRKNKKSPWAEYTHGLMKGNTVTSVFDFSQKKKKKNQRSNKRLSRHSHARKNCLLLFLFFLLLVLYCYISLFFFFVDSPFRSSFSHLKF